MKVFFLWTVAGVTILGVVSHFVLGDFRLLIFLPGAFLGGVYSYPLQVTFLDSIMGVAGIAAQWILAGLILRTIYRLFTPQAVT